MEVYCIHEEKRNWTTYLVIMIYYLVKMRKRSHNYEIRDETPGRCEMSLIGLQCVVCYAMYNPALDSNTHTHTHTHSHSVPQTPEVTVLIITARPLGLLFVASMSLAGFLTAKFCFRWTQIDRDTSHLFLARSYNLVQPYTIPKAFE